MMDLDYRPFTHEEDAQILSILKQHSRYSCVEDILEPLAHNWQKPDYVVIQRAFQLGLINYGEFSHYLLSHRPNGWRSDEISLLINHVEMGRKKLANILQRSAQSVNKQFIELRLRYGGTEHTWSTKERSFLKSNISNQSLSDLCLNLNRTAIDIKHMSIELGIARPGLFNQFKGRAPKIKHHQNTFAPESRVC